MSRSLTYDEAEEIAEDFEDLIGTEYKKDGIKWEIDGVIIRLFGPIPQYASLDEFRNEHETHVPPDGNEGETYHVLVISHSTVDGTMQAVTIQEYAASNGINYSFPS